MVYVCEYVMGFRSWFVLLKILNPCNKCLPFQDNPRENLRLLQGHWWKRYRGHLGPDVVGVGRARQSSRRNSQWSCWSAFQRIPFRERSGDIRREPLARGGGDLVEAEFRELQNCRAWNLQSSMIRWQSFLGSARSRLFEWSSWNWDPRERKH